VASKCTAGFASAVRAIQSPAWPHSVVSLFRNLRRAGTLPNSSLTSIRVPTGAPTARSLRRTPPSTQISRPVSSSALRVRRRSEDTAAIAGSASPRKP
jgi:hypothetical protein